MGNLSTKVRGLHARRARAVPASSPLISPGATST